MKKANSFSFLFLYLHHYRWTLFWGIVFIIFTTGFQLFSPWILKSAVNFIEFNQEKSLDFIHEWLHSLLPAANTVSLLIAYALLLVLVSSLQGIFRYLMRNTLIGVSRKIEYDIRNDYFAHLQSLSLSFYQGQKTGDLMARATNDLEAVRSMMGPGIMHLISTVVVFTVALLLMFRIDSHLALWSLVPLPFIAFIVNRLLKKIHRAFKKIQEQFSTVTAKVQENLSGIRIVKAYVQEKHEIDAFKLQNRELVDRNLSLAFIRANLRSVIEILVGIGTIIILWQGGKRVIQEQMNLGELVAFFVYFNLLSWPMIAFGWVLNLWQQGLASTGRIIQIFDTKPEIRDTPQTDFGIRTLIGEIEFRNVSFAYSAESPMVLKNINLKIPAGQTLAIVGPTGSGKTTLVNLIPRLYDCQSGTISIDNHDIRRIPLKTLRSHIGYTPQETFLFSMSIRENIGFGLCMPSIPEIEKATETSQIRADLDQFPEGLDTMVGERGITLSGGQKQRTAISRAVICDPTILILDDALSAVDTHTEEEILKHLRDLMQHRTSIIVSHRISTVKDADKIIVLREGEIVEQGTHDTLIDLKGYYQQLYERQMLEASLEEL
jgi:ATP-binding cassette subfamily B protein